MRRLVINRYEKLLTSKDNVAHYSIILTNNVHWTHWAPLPTFADDPV